jgi:hypothetical protein
MDETLPVKVVDSLAFAYGLPPKNLIKMVSFNFIATVLRKFNVARTPADGKVKYIHYSVKHADQREYPLLSEPSRLRSLLAAKFGQGLKSS